MIQQLTDVIKNCNGCGACVVGCKDRCVKMVENEEGLKRPVINEDGCNKCNACKLYCPLFMPVRMPEFDEWYEFDEKYMDRDMAPIYRQTMRSIKARQHTEFVGTQCQIAALISLLGDRIPANLRLYPLICTADTREKLGCKDCKS